MDKKTIRWHHCCILEKHHMFSFESFISCYLKFIFKCLYGLAPSLLNEFVSRQQDARRVNTQASGIGIPMCKTSFGKTIFSVIGAIKPKLQHNCNILTKYLILAERETTLFSHLNHEHMSADCLLYIALYFCTCLFIRPAFITALHSKLYCIFLVFFFLFLFLFLAKL